MKDAISAFLTPAEAEIEKIWENAIFVFDTNVLLDFYRYSKKTRCNLTEILEDINDNLWLPYYIAEEFIENRESAVKQYFKTLNDSRTQMKNNYCSLRNSFRSRDNDDSTSCIIKNFDLIGTALTALESEFDKLEQNLQVASNTNNDDILNKLLEIYDGKVGSRLSESEVADYKEEGINRFQNKVPPGYKDNSKSKNKYGDFFIWKEVMKKCNNEKKHLIFISNDLKEDWVCSKSKEIKKPRLELVTEFTKETNQKFLFYSLDGFLTEYNSKRNKETDADTESEVKSFVKESESKIKIADSINGVIPAQDYENLDYLSNRTVPNSYLTRLISGNQGLSADIWREIIENTDTDPLLTRLNSANQSISSDIWRIISENIDANSLLTSLNSANQSISSDFLKKITENIDTNPLLTNFNSANQIISPDILGKN